MRKIIKALFFGILGGLLLVGTTYAHAAYLRSTPGADAVIVTPPTRVDIWFEQELFRRQSENTISVTGPDGKLVSAGDTAIDDDDRTHIWVRLQSGLSAGKYLVEWKNTSVEDGHPTEGSFTFIIDPQAAVTNTPMQESNESVTLTDTPIPDSTQAGSTPQPTPTNDPPVSTTTNPCARGLLPMAGLVAFGFVEHFRKKKFSS